MNRFCATEIWSKAWFCRLTPTYKLFFKFLCDNCNNAGIWDVNWPLVQFHTWEKEPLDPAMFGNREADGKPRVIALSESKWFIRTFVLYQQKIKAISDLNPDNGAHKQIVFILQREGLIDVNHCEIYEKPPLSPPLAPPVGLRYSKGINTLNTTNNINTIGTEETFVPRWAQYPKKDGRKDALKHWKATIKTPEDLQKFDTALSNYLASERVFNGFTKNGSTFFNNWTDWIDYKETVCPKCKGQGKYTSTTGYESICPCPRGNKARISKQ